jgi:demethylmenaquinone methyltransferase/2-methoxy-6-polyprenyl-1,4-benzoquinol methylase
VIGGDITRAMLRQAMQRADASESRLKLVECSAEAPPFRETSFDAVVHAYLLRYVEDVPGTIDALGRLLKPGGVMASLDFGVPRGVWYPLWRVYTDAVLPAGGRVFSQDWRRVGAFLGPNIRNFHRRWPPEKLLGAWRDAGFVDVTSRDLTLGGATVIWGRRS